MKVNFVSRSEWNARAARGSAGVTSGSRGVVIHHIGNGSFAKVNPKTMTRTVQNWHLDHPSVNYNDIAYSLTAGVYGGEGYVCFGRSTPDNPKNRPGATGWVNPSTFAVLSLRGLDDGPLNSADIEVLAHAVVWCRKNGASDEVTGHKDWMSTACPGYVYAVLKQIKDRADALMKPAPAPKPPAPKPTPKPTPVDPYANIKHKVTKGQTLSSIAEKYGTTYQYLAYLNGLSDPNKIKVGQVLWVGWKGTAPGKYKVQKGDSLSKIAKFSGTTWQRLKAVNKIANANQIEVGQVILIK